MTYLEAYDALDIYLPEKLLKNKHYCKAHRMALDALEKMDSIKKAIEEIENLNPVDYGSGFSYEAHSGAREMKNDILRILEGIEQ